jgi:hypothetical protein
VALVLPAELALRLVAVIVVVIAAGVDVVDAEAAAEEASLRRKNGSL